MERKKYNSWSNNKLYPKFNNSYYKNGKFAKNPNSLQQKVTRFLINNPNISNQILFHVFNAKTRKEKKHLKICKKRYYNKNPHLDRRNVKNITIEEFENRNVKYAQTISDLIDKILG